MLTFIGDLQVPLRGHLHVGYRGCHKKNVAPRQLRSWDGTYQTFYFEEVVVLATDQSVSSCERKSARTPYIFY
jgi:hypothetical protein